MKKIYEGHDGIADAGTFYEWMMSAKGVKRVYHRVEPNLDTTRYIASKMQLLNIGEVAITKMALQWRLKSKEIQNKPLNKSVLLLKRIFQDYTIKIPVSQLT